MKLFSRLNITLEFEYLENILLLQNTWIQSAPQSNPTILSSDYPQNDLFPQKQTPYSKPNKEWQKKLPTNIRHAKITW